MKKFILKLFLKIFVFFDKILILIFNKSFLRILKDYIDNEYYVEKKLCSKKTKFFTPNQITNWRVQTIFSKEPETLEWIDEFSNREKISFWDIGSNIGLYSIYAAQRHENIKIQSFEPSTNNLRILSRNISINNLSDKININQIPLTNKKSFFSEMYDSEFIEGWSMSSYGNKINFEGKKLNYKQNYRLLGLSIDFLIKNKIVEYPNYIKIDVDGNEHNILKGADDCLKSSKLKSILIEINENYEEQYKIVTDIMKKYNFSLRHKKRNEILYKNYSKIYNYIFDKYEN